MEKVAVSVHAWEQFVSRYRKLHGTEPSCAMAELVRLLRNAEEDRLGGGEVLRIIDNGMTPALYFRAEGWRFVVSEDGNLVTVERIIFRGREGRLKKIPRRLKRRAKREKRRGRDF